MSAPEELQPDPLAILDGLEQDLRQLIEGGHLKTPAYRQLAEQLVRTRRATTNIGVLLRERYGDASYEFYADFEAGKLLPSNERAALSQIMAETSALIRELMRQGPPLDAPLGPNAVQSFLEAVHDHIAQHLTIGIFDLNGQPAERQNAVSIELHDMHHTALRHPDALEKFQRLLLFGRNKRLTVNVSANVRQLLCAYYTIRERQHPRKGPEIYDAFVAILEHIFRGEGFEVFAMGDQASRMQLARPLQEQTDEAMRAYLQTLIPTAFQSVAAAEYSLQASREPLLRIGVTGSIVTQAQQEEALHRNIVHVRGTQQGIRSIRETIQGFLGQNAQHLRFAQETQTKPYAAWLRARRVLCKPDVTDRQRARAVGHVLESDAVIIGQPKANGRALMRHINRLRRERLISCNISTEDDLGAAISRDMNIPAPLPDDHEFHTLREVHD